MINTKLKHNIFTYQFQKEIERGWSKHEYIDLLIKCSDENIKYVSVEDVEKRIGPRKTEEQMLNIVDTTKIPPYWKSKNHYDPDAANFFKDTILTVEEKIDGSQFSFGHLPNMYGRYNLVAKSKNANLDTTHPMNDMFAPAIKHILSKQWYNIIPKDVVLRAEALSSVKHNRITYGRTPLGHCVVFGAEDLTTGRQVPEHVWRTIASELGLETVMRFVSINTKDLTYQQIIDSVLKYMECTSALGNSKIEGVVLKRERDHILTQDGVPIFVKVVSEAFREIQSVPKQKAEQNDIIGEIVDMVKLDAVYFKAIQHMQESTGLTYTNSDIGPLINQIKKEVVEDLKEPAKDLLWQWAEKQVLTGCVTPFAKFYQNYLSTIKKEEVIDAVVIERSETTKKGTGTVETPSQDGVAADHN